MAAIATTKTSPFKKEIFRLPAPVTGGVRKPCKLCDTSFSSEEEEEDQLEISTLKEDIAIIWKENQDLANKLKTMHEDEMKIKSMNEQMDDFIAQIPLGKIVKDAASQTENIERADYEHPNEEIVKVKNEALSREKNLWKEKEVLLSQLLMFQKKSAQMNSKKKAQTQVKRKFWGRTTITWKALGQQIRQDTPPGPKVSHKLKTSKPNPYFIPFQPKPIKSFTNKSHVKPPPRLPPAYPSINVFHVARPVSCNSVVFDDAPIETDFDTTIVREMFANALERAIASNDIEYSQEDWNNNEVDEDINDDVDNLTNFPAEPIDEDREQFTEGSEHFEEDECVPETDWASHPYYDTSEEEDQQHEVLLDYDDVQLDDEDDDDAWANSPYY